MVIIRSESLTVSVILSILLPQQAPAQSPVLELDHVYIVVQPPAS